MVEYVDWFLGFGEIVRRKLRDDGSFVVDIFAGSNTTGQVAEVEGRRWIAIDEVPEYVAASAFRFLEKSASPGSMIDIHESIIRGETVDLTSITRGGAQAELAL